MITIAHPEESSGELKRLIFIKCDAEKWSKIYILLYKIFDFYLIGFSDKIISSKAYERVMKYTPYYHIFFLI